LDGDTKPPTEAAVAPIPVMTAKVQTADLAVYLYLDELGDWVAGWRSAKPPIANPAAPPP
jgi:hypothetical protein